MSSIEQQAEEVIREARLAAPRIRGMNDTISLYTVKALSKAGLLKHDIASQIIRTPEELEALHPDAVTLDRFEAFDKAKDWLTPEGKVNKLFLHLLPALVIFTPEQLNEALELLKEEEE